MILKAISGVAMLFPRSIAMKIAATLGATLLAAACMCRAYSSYPIESNMDMIFLCVAWCIAAAVFACGVWGHKSRPFAKGDRVVLRHGPTRRGTVLRAGPGSAMVEWDGDGAVGTYLPDSLQYGGVQTQHAALAE